eukprot:TRINITY_DN5717_c0_g1_i1.p1 TRINITY_DN5717_c0_g1~~TRINITY_DN5717_c0_g1_i1.p1  ORF type:complete len:546 (-),score=64.17 TRINITY_DN5717_c0_g1_i1:309-1910(-)
MALAEPRTDQGELRTVSDAVMEWTINVTPEGKRSWCSQTFQLRPHKAFNVPELEAWIDAKIHSDGHLSVYLCMHNRPVKVQSVIWVGPRNVKNYGPHSDKIKDAHGVGRRDFWMLNDHVQNDVVVITVGVVYAAGPEDKDALPPLEASYLLQNSLGSGAYGSVYDVVARDENFNLNPGVNAVAKCQKRLGIALHEASILALLSDHPGFPRFFGLYMDANNQGTGPQACIVMQKLQRSIEDIFKTRQRSPERVVKIGLRCIDLLQVLHSHGIVHRDIKPDNIMMGSDGDVYLVDFGVATYFRLAGLHTSTKKSSWNGSPAYISIRAQDGMDTPFSDLESLAYTLLKLAIGDLPWRHVSASDKYEKWAEIFRLKKDACGLTQFVTDAAADSSHKEQLLAAALLRFLERCRDAGDDEEPDYEELSVILSNTGLGPGRRVVKADHANCSAEEGITLVPDAEITDVEACLQSSSASSAFHGSDALMLQPPAPCLTFQPPARTLQPDLTLQAQPHPTRRAPPTLSCFEPFRHLMGPCFL